MMAVTMRAVCSGVEDKRAEWIMGSDNKDGL
jgi:hypothetical protein